MDHTVFVTGGAGYIGSHCIVSLLEAGYDVIAIDNFANSVSEKGADGAHKAPSLERVQQITGKSLKFLQCDLLDVESLRKIFSQVFLQHFISTLFFTK
jgi:UDP-glucose 4-epimerase